MQPTVMDRGPLGFPGVEASGLRLPLGTQVTQMTRAGRGSPRPRGLAPWQRASQSAAVLETRTTRGAACGAFWAGRCVRCDRNPVIDRWPWGGARGPERSRRLARSWGLWGAGEPHLPWGPSLLAHSYSCRNVAVRCLSSSHGGEHVPRTRSPATVNTTSFISECPSLPALPAVGKGARRRPPALVRRPDVQGDGDRRDSRRRAASGDGNRGACGRPRWLTCGASAFVWSQQEKASPEGALDGRTQQVTKRSLSRQAEGGPGLPRETGGNEGTENNVRRDVCETTVR